MPEQTGPGGTCWLHKVHRPAPLSLVVHHAQPRGMGGADSAENRYRVCDTGHRNVHVILSAFVFGRPVVGGSRGERKLARIGYDAWVAAGRPGNPHAAFALHSPDGTGEDHP